MPLFYISDEPKTGLAQNFDKKMVYFSRKGGVEMSLKLYICPECGWLRTVSRRSTVECFKCGIPQMEAVKLTFQRYSEMTLQERQDYVESWFYIHKRTKVKKF